jgi:hypothetical protein
VKRAFDEAGLTASLAGQPAPLVFNGPEAGPDAPGPAGGAAPGPSGGAGATADEEHGPAHRAGEERVARDSMEVAAQLEQDEQRP